MKNWLLTLSVSLALAAGAAQAAGNPAAGKEKSATLGCIACHGEDGNSPNPIWPKLAGQHPSYIAKQIGAFKAGDRKDDAMSPMALIIGTDEDLADLAAYFASQKRQAGEAGTVEQMTVGQQLFRGGNPATGVAACAACHGPAGAGIGPANFPSVAGQHAPYVEKALHDFKAGTRVSDPNQMMRSVAAKMTDAEIAAVAAYVQQMK
ncbi:MAG: cytochrome c4 [Gammaproteobacteria bacterium]|jgi:cytochrome c553|nr:cytochrome c4 [Gammaproteobacteria bacterium]